MTQSGRLINPLDPTIQAIDIEDIAHALSQICRANGHTQSFYSVAQHCINCAMEAKARGLSKTEQLAALLHDASEAYMADLTRPVKQQLPDYSRYEDQLLAIIFKKYGLDPQLPSCIKAIDDAMLYAEFKALVGAELIEYKAELKSVPNFNEQLCSKSKQDYLHLFDELVKKS